VRRVLERIASERGLPEAIVLDNGPEFRGRALAAWSEERGVRLEFIQPGKPAQNAYAESFNGRLAGVYCKGGKPKPDLSS
jgi:putative transposase